MAQFGIPLPGPEFVKVLLSLSPVLLVAVVGISYFLSARIMEGKEV